MFVKRLFQVPFFSTQMSNFTRNSNVCMAHSRRSFKQAGRMNPLRNLFCSRLRFWSVMWGYHWVVWESPSTDIQISLSRVKGQTQMLGPDSGKWGSTVLRGCPYYRGGTVEINDIWGVKAQVLRVWFEQLIVESLAILLKLFLFHGGRRIDLRKLHWIVGPFLSAGPKVSQLLQSLVGGCSSLKLISQHACQRIIYT